MITCLVLLQQCVPTVIHVAHSVPMLQSLLDLLDTFNSLAPGLPLEDADDLAWSGVARGKRYLDLDENCYLLTDITAVAKAQLDDKSLKFTFKVTLQCILTCKPRKFTVDRWIVPRYTLPYVGI